MARPKLKSIAAAGLTLFLAVAAAAAIFKILQKSRGLATAQDPDGKYFLRIVSVSVGTNFACQVGAHKPWVQTILQALPPALGSLSEGWLGMGGGALDLSSYRGETNVAVFTAGLQPSGSGTPEALVVFDDQGNRSVAAVGGGTIGSDDGKFFRSVKGWVLQAFPRRSRTLKLCFVRLSPATKSWVPVAEFHIRNPMFKPYPVWVTEPLPAVKIDRDLSVTLTELKTGISFENSSRPAKTNEVAITRATFQLRQAGHPTSSWRPVMVEISDATGNHWSPFMPEDSVKHNGVTDELSFIGELWEGEAAWKVRVEFSRITDFEPDELWTVQGLKVPQATQSLELQNATTHHGARISLVAFTGSDADQPGQFKWVMSKGEPRISVNAEPASEGWQLSLVKVLDNQGRAVEVHPTESHGWSDGQMVFGFKLQPDASSVDLTLAIRKSRFVEFTVKPTFAAQKSEVH